jgi:hypothetical protein
VVLCSPFVDDDVLVTVEGLAHSASRVGCALGVITGRHAIDRVAARLGPPMHGSTRVIGCARLHAKFYLAIGRRGEITEAIVTSANLTAVGLTSNIELGVRICASTPYGRALLHQIERFAYRLTVYRRPAWKKH